MLCKLDSMQVLLYDDSGQIAERLIELINGTKEVLEFYNAHSVKDAIGILTEQGPGITILHLKFANRNAAEMLQKIKNTGISTVVLLIFDVADEYNAGVFNIHEKVYVLDMYKDFEKIPGIIGEIIRKT